MREEGEAGKGRGRGVKKTYINVSFRAEKHPAQLSAHPQSCVRAQVIVEGATWEC